VCLIRVGAKLIDFNINNLIFSVTNFSVTTSNQILCSLTSTISNQTIQFIQNLSHSPLLDLDPGCFGRTTTRDTFSSSRRWWVCFLFMTIKSLN